MILPVRGPFRPLESGFRYSEGSKRLNSDLAIAWHQESTRWAEIDAVEHLLHCMASRREDSPAMAGGSSLKSMRVVPIPGSEGAFDGGYFLGDRVKP